ncbi:hypothetical protein, partial [Lactovum odontotermitis]
MKRISLLFITFWLPSLIVLSLSLAAGDSSSTHQGNPASLSFLTIFTRNMIVVVLLIVAGYIHKKFAYLIFYFNSVYFSIVLVLAGNAAANLLEVSKYGIFETLALSVACYIGI